MANLSYGWTSWQGVAQFVNRYAFAGTFVKDKVVLDIACANGWGTNYLSRKGAKLVVGGDISKGFIEYASTRYGSRGRTVFSLADAEQLPFGNNTFDVVSSCETIEHLNRPECFLSEARRVLKDNGLLICTTPNKKMGFNPEHDKFSIEELVDMVGKHFDETCVWGMYRGLNPERQRDHVLKYRINPKGGRVINRLIGFFFQGERLIRLEEVAFDLTSKLTKGYKPCRIESNPAPPAKLIMVAYKTAQAAQQPL
jgi:SAM-dependent methyltransferase